ncbi:MAG: hypothetical protein K0Q50_190 [Vampirovibrio sp.]|jgi:endonuclease YncB( thermonuclease family)|nr:hypothetical protein [Vampirovibrio sp.]
MMRRILLLTVLFFIASAQAEKVCSAHDGDTIKLCTGESIRFNGIDAPELKQPYGVPARDYLRRLVVGKDVRLACKGKSYNRKVCGVYLGDLDVQRDMVDHGFAYDYFHYSRGRFADAEAFARGRKLGVWAMPDGGERPWDYRRSKR